MAKDSIVTLMTRDHGKITKLIVRLEKNKCSTWDEVKPDFEVFKWELQRHFVTEERAIFTYLDQDNTETYDMMEELLEEHKVITGALDDLERTLKKCNKSGLKPFLQDLQAHKQFEDEEFYPRLEKELTDEQKRQIVVAIQSPIG
jgi:hemerythrin-like domain-containing protein